jgi:hypothetical protein
LNARDENFAALSNRIDYIRCLGKFAFSLMTYAIILANAWFRIDNRHTCDHRVDTSINIMKYLNGPHDGCIGPQMSPCILSRNFSGSICILRGEGIKINFLVAHVMHMKSDVLGNLDFLKL